MLNPTVVRQHHTGIAVASVDASRQFYEQQLGAIWLGDEVVTTQQVRVGFLQLGASGSPLIELLEPLTDDSPLARFLARRGPGLHHVAYQVDDLPAALARLAAAGVRLIDTVPRAGAHQMQVAFLHPDAAGGVLIELCAPRQEQSTPSRAIL